MILGPNSLDAIRLYAITFAGRDTPDEIVTMEKRTDGYEILATVSWLKECEAVIMDVTPEIDWKSI